MQGLQAYYGLGDKDLWQVVTGFGAGMARHQRVCGAISGGIMALGLITAHERQSDRDDRRGLQEETYTRVQDLLQRFEERYGTLECREMTGYDFLDPAQNQAFRESGGLERICQPSVRLAVEAVARWKG